MGMMQEFKDFAVKGNVVDMGVGIVIGAAFTSIVTSFVSDIVNPIIGLFTGGVDFSNLFINLGEGTFTSLKAAQDAGADLIATFGGGSITDAAKAVQLCLANDVSTVYEPDG